MAWSARIDEADDLPELDYIEGELTMLSEAWVGPLRLKIINRRRELKDIANRPVQAPSYAPGAKFGLPPADGRWLYAYRIDDAAFQELQTYLATRQGIYALASGNDPALFVLWASEWHRRSYRGGGLSWSPLLSDLGFRTTGQSDQGMLRDIARRGLQAWGRPVIKLSNHAYLGTLAREGGFPAAAVESGEGGWASRILTTIVGALLGNVAADAETALTLAEEVRGRLPQTFDDNDFVQLCADLAFSIVTIRREAEPKAAEAGQPVAIWLDLNQPGWREALPLSIGDRTADRLVDSLMAVEAITGAAVGTDRLLQYGDDGWFEAVRIRLDGAIDSKAMAQIDPAFGRLRAFASGDLARHMPGELALFEPPAQGDKQWSARSVRMAHGVHAVPFAATLELDLRSGERRVSRIALPGGKPRRGQLLIAEREEGEELAPRCLRIIGSGSGQFRAEALYLQVPAGWKVTATAGEEAQPLGMGVGASQLWHIKGGAFVTDESGDRYRIRCGQANDRSHRMDLIGNECRWAEVQATVDLFVGPPHFRTAADGGQLLIREPGTRQWRQAPRVLPVGHFELGWRKDDILLDRRRIAILPSGAELARSGLGPNLQYDLTGLAGVEVIPDADAPVRVCENDSQWRAMAAKAATNRFGATIRFPTGPDLAVTIAYPCPAGLAQWDGKLVSTSELLTLADLPDVLAVDGGGMELVAELNEPGKPHLAELSWEFEREFPLASVRKELAGLLMPSGIEAWISLSMNGGQHFWEVRPFELNIEWRSDQLTTDRGVVDESAHLYGRPMADPCREVDFGSYNLLSDSNHRPVSFPADVGGPWLIYLRSGARVLTRPRCLTLVGPPAEAGTDLGKAMAVNDYRTMVAQVEAWLADADSNGGSEAVQELNALVCALEGLPPATFKVLELLPQYPDVLTRMAMNARPDQREAIMGLSRDLPFAWCLLPRKSWEGASREIFDRITGLLAGHPDLMMERAIEAVKLTQRSLVQHEPLLAQIFESDATDNIADVSQRFLNRSSHRIRGAYYGRYRRKLADQLPAYFITQGFNQQFIDTLDAPCAAALAATGCWAPDAAAVRHIKTVAHNFPNYFAEAFAVWLKESA
ncbi:MAG: hypothetical protein CL820_10855 [Croceicoccus sp.]|nr:hypothetical protein [Croceicoccus sp.]MAL26373.1 hypothetical protein [Croceicoccus sp.]